MNVFETIMIAFALAMDCFTISISCGIFQKKMGRQVWTMASVFGFFQALMPLLGWLLVDLFRNEIEFLDHWIAFGLLFFIGVKMVLDGRKPKCSECSFDPSKPFVLFTLAVATSIDALAVGFSMMGLGITSLKDLTFPLLIIGAVSFFLSVLGKFIGVKVGKCFNFPAEQMGGFILILIGTKVLVEHLYLGV